MANRSEYNHGTVVHYIVDSTKDGDTMLMKGTAWLLNFIVYTVC